MPESPPKRPARPPAPGGGTPQQLRPVPHAEYHHIPINDSHDDPHKLPSAIILQPEKSPMLAEMQSPYQPTSIALETKDLFVHRWLHRRAQVFSYFHLLFALVLLILGIVSVVVQPTFYHVGVGFWLAIFIVVTAGVGLLAARYKTQELVGVFLILSVVAVFLSFCGLTVVAVGLSKDINSYNVEVFKQNGESSVSMVTPTATTAVTISITSSRNSSSTNVSVTHTTSSRPEVNATQKTNVGFGAGASTGHGQKSQQTSKVAVGAFLVIAVSMEIIMALLSWLTCWHALCGSRRKGDCLSEMVDFCSDTVCFCCTTP